MPDEYHVHVTKDYLVFSAAHFITFNGNICERLHGHNYRVAVDIAAPLDENSYVIDFIALRDTTKGIVDELDHHMLLPAEHDQIRVQSTETEVTATFEDRRWVFPKEDCVVLPMANTTTELLAKFIGCELISRMSLGTALAYTRLTVGVDENNGQWGYWTDRH